MLAAAAARPDRLIVGVDASAAAMAVASRRAAATPRRGGLPNALFVVAAVEALPRELDGRADLVTVHFPWGSLLRGLLAADPAVMTGLTRVMRPGATLSLLLSSTDRDRGAGIEPLHEPALRALAAAYADWGLDVTEARPATPADVAAAHSTWGKRLGAGGRRPAWLLRARLDLPPSPDAWTAAADRRHSSETAATLGPAPAAADEPGRRRRGAHRRGSRDATAGRPVHLPPTATSARPPRRATAGLAREGMAGERAPDGGDRRRRPRGPGRQRARRHPVPPRRSPYRRPRRRLRKNRMTRTMMMISSSVVSRMAPPRCRDRLPGRPRGLTYVVETVTANR